MHKPPWRQACLIICYLIAGIGHGGPIERLPENAIRAGFDWPAYRGPCCDNSATPSGHALIDNPSDIALVWTSEETTPPGRSCKANTSGCTVVEGGYASPVVANGKIYLFYYKPSGTVRDENRHADTPSDTKWLINADDIVVCVDAQTGQTVWKTVFKEQGLNFNAFGKSGPMLTPCVYEGKVYALGTTGQVYCLDAATGDSLWKSDIGYRHEIMEWLRERWLAREYLGSFNRDFCSSPLVIGNAVICNTHQTAKGYQQGDIDYFPDRPGGLCAFDPVTGDSLWSRDTLAAYSGTPAKWSHNGEEYILSWSGYYEETPQNLRCIVPHTGEVLWKFSGDNNALAVHGDYTVVSVDGQSTSLVKLTLDGPEIIWTYNEKYISEALFHGDYLYLRFSSGTLKCFDYESATPLAGIPIYTVGTRTFIASDGLILFDEEQGHTGGRYHLLKADPADFRELGRWTVDAAQGYDLALTPAFADGRLIVRMRNDIACYDFRKSMTISVKEAKTASLTKVKPTCMGNRMIRIEHWHSALSMNLYDLQGKSINLTHTGGGIFKSARPLPLSFFLCEITGKESSKSMLVGVR